MGRSRRCAGPNCRGGRIAGRRLIASKLAPLRAAARSCSEGRAALRREESEPTMKRVRGALWPIIGLGAVALSSWLLFKELRGLRIADVGAGLANISPIHWALAVGGAALAYVALAWYDQIALAHLGRKLSWRFVGLVSFTTY